MNIAETSITLPGADVCGLVPIKGVRGARPRIAESFQGANDDGSPYGDYARFRCEAGYTTIERAYSGWRELAALISGSTGWGFEARDTKDKNNFDLSSKQLKALKSGTNAYATFSQKDESGTKINIQLWGEERTVVVSIDHTNFESHIIALHLKALGCGKDDFECREQLYSKACKEHHLRSCDDLSFLYRRVSFGYAYGSGVVRNDRLAVEWATKGAVAGFDDSMLTLGRYYLDGKIADKNPKEAFRWLKAAADSGCQPAMPLVAEMYEKGDGTDRDLIQAYSWYNRGGRLARTHSLDREMPRSDVIRAQELSLQWKPTKPRSTCPKEESLPVNSGGLQTFGALTDASLPRSLIVGTVVGDPELIIENTTGYLLQVQFSGPSPTQTVTVPAGLSKSVSLVPGSYSVTAKVGAGGVTPLLGTETYQSNFQYKVRYVLTSQ